VQILHYLNTKSNPFLNPNPNPNPNTNPNTNSLFFYLYRVAGDFHPFGKTGIDIRIIAIDIRYSTEYFNNIPCSSNEQAPAKQRHWLAVACAAPYLYGIYCTSAVQGFSQDFRPVPPSSAVNAYIRIRRCKSFLCGHKVNIFFTFADTNLILQLHKSITKHIGTIKVTVHCYKSLQSFLLNRWSYSKINYSHIGRGSGKPCQGRGGQLIP